MFPLQCIAVDADTIMREFLARKITKQLSSKLTNEKLSILSRDLFISLEMSCWRDQFYFLPLHTQYGAVLPRLKATKER